MPSVVRFLIIAALWFGVVFMASRALGETDGTLASLMRAPVHRTDSSEADEVRRKRLRSIAAAIDSATTNSDERAWLIMTAIRESGLAAYVTEDHPKCSTGQGGVCDGGLAFGTWQVHRMARTEDKAKQASTALRLFRAAGTRCARAGHDYWLGGISGYARGLACEWGPAKQRLEHLRAIRGRL